MGKDGWISWHGGGCPVPAGTSVEVRFKSGNTTRARYPDLIYWEHRNGGEGGDIIAYRILDSQSANTDRDQLAKLGAHEPACAPDTLSVRDHFAMAALTGMLACWTIETEPNEGWAIDAYRIADAMMKERSK